MVSTKTKLEWLKRYDLGANYFIGLHLEVGSEDMSVPKNGLNLNFLQTSQFKISYNSLESNRPNMYVLYIFFVWDNVLIEYYGLV